MWCNKIVTDKYPYYEYGEYTLPFVLSHKTLSGGFMSIDHENLTLTFFLLDSVNTTTKYKLVALVLSTELFDLQYQPDILIPILISNWNDDRGYDFNVTIHHTNITLGDLLERDVMGKSIMEFNPTTQHIKTYLENPVTWPDSFFIPYYFGGCEKYFDRDFLIFSVKTF